MGEMLCVEFKRLRDGRIFWVTIVVETLLMLAHILLEVVPKALNPLAGYMGANTVPHTLYTSWIGGHSNVYLTVYMYIFPIMATISYAITYYTDCRDGYVKNVITRISRKKYLLAKYVVTFISGGVTVTIPIIINFMITAAMLPAITPMPGNAYVNSNTFMASMAYYHPLIFFIVFMVMYFVYGGVFACIALAGSCFIKNVFLLSLFPFVIWYGLSIVSSMVNSTSLLKSISPAKMLTPYNSYTTIVSVIGVAFVLCAVGFCVYYWKGMNDDVI